jgi:hypothetical protein
MAQQGLPIAISSVFVVLAMLASCEAATASFEPEYCAAGPGANSPPCHSPGSIPPDHRLVAETTGAWRLLRTPNPLGGADAVAITRTADTARSDADFAGLMLRCTETGPEALIILIVPLTPRAQPHVTFNSGGDRVMRLDGTVVLPGSSILLPRQAAVMLLGPWRSREDVSIEVETEGEFIRGVVALNGLDRASQLLMANCLAP